MNEIVKLSTELTSAVSFTYCLVVTHLWQCPSTVQRSNNQHKMFCAKLLVQEEEILLCTMSTHSDLQLLPFIWALWLTYNQLLIENSHWICMHTPLMLYWSCSVHNIDRLFVLCLFIPDNATSKYKLISQGNPWVLAARTNHATCYHNTCIHHSVSPYSLYTKVVPYFESNPWCLRKIDHSNQKCIYLVSKVETTKFIVHYKFACTKCQESEHCLSFVCSDTASIYFSSPDIWKQLCVSADWEFEILDGRFANRDQRKPHPTLKMCMEVKPDWPHSVNPSGQVIDGSLRQAWLLWLSGKLILVICISKTEYLLLE